MSTRKSTVLAFLVALSSCTDVQRSAGLVRLEDLDKPPKAVSQPLMEYTEVWHRSRIEAQATVALTIQEDGSVTDVSLVRATNPEIGRAAVKTIKEWRFERPTSRGVPARVALHVPIVSNLQNTKFIMP